MTIPPGAMCL